MTGGFFHPISLIEISQVGKMYDPVNLSVGTNTFKNVNGKLDNFPEAETALKFPSLGVCIAKHDLAFSALYLIK